MRLSVSLKSSYQLIVTYQDHIDSYISINPAIRHQTQQIQTETGTSWLAFLIVIYIHHLVYTCRTQLMQLCSHHCASWWPNSIRWYELIGTNDQYIDIHILRLYDSLIDVDSEFPLPVNTFRHGTIPYWCVVTKHGHKNIESDTAYTTVSWSNSKQWPMVYASDLMIRMRFSIHPFWNVTECTFLMGNNHFLVLPGQYHDYW